MKDIESIEIVERSSGFWVVDRSGVVEGPFDTLELANTWITVEFGH
jgi:hypothetical protein